MMLDNKVIHKKPTIKSTNFWPGYNIENKLNRRQYAAHNAKNNALESQKKHFTLD